MGARRGHHEDSIYRDGNRWRGAISLWGRDGKRLRKKVSGATRAEVAAKLRVIRQGLDQGLPVPNDRLTVAAFLDRWVRDVLPGQVENSTLDDYADTVRLHLAPTLGRKVLSRLTVADVDGLLRVKREAGYKPNSLRIMRAVLRRALSQAEREGLLARNVAALASPPRVPTVEGRTLTVEQARALLGELEEHRLSALVTLMLAFGLRRGEALALRWDDVDLENGEVQVRRGLRRVRIRPEPADGPKWRLEVGTLKTQRSRRVLYLTPELTRALVAHRARQLTEREAVGSAWQDSGLIFASEIGTPLDPDNFSHVFSHLCQRAGLGHWHPHELRHSGASLMLAQGTPLHVVSEVLGHSSITVTKDVYGHLVAGEKRRAAESMSAALFGARSGLAPSLAPKAAFGRPEEGAEARDGNGP